MGKNALPGIGSTPDGLHHMLLGLSVCLVRDTGAFSFYPCGWDHGRHQARSPRANEGKPGEMFEGVPAFNGVRVATFTRETGIEIPS